MKIKKILMAALIAMAGVQASAAECEVGIGIAPIQGGDNVADGIARKLEAKMRTMLTYVGVAAGDYDCQFFLTGRFDHAYSQEASGVGGRVLVKTDLQLAICDNDNKKVYATATFPLKGVGGSDEQALTRALSSLNANNTQFVNFVENGKAKIIDYFNKNYPTYLSKAKSALQSRSYDEALYWAMAVPECCQGYDQAQALVSSIVSDKTNYDSEMLLTQAQGEWAANPTAEGAAAAYAYLSQIDPSSPAYAKAKALGSKIAASVKADYDFETKEKYRTEKDLEKQRIAAARDAAVAWAKNQPKTVYKTNWIVW